MFRSGHWSRLWRQEIVMASSLANHSRDQSVMNCGRPEIPNLSLCRAVEPETDAPLPSADKRGGGRRNTFEGVVVPSYSYHLPHLMVGVGQHTPPVCSFVLFASAAHSLSHSLPFRLGATPPRTFAGRTQSPPASRTVAGEVDITAKYGSTAEELPSSVRLIRKSHKSQNSASVGGRRQIPSATGCLW